MIQRLPLRQGPMPLPSRHVRAPARRRLARAERAPRQLRVRPPGLSLSLSLSLYIYTHRAKVREQVGPCHNRRRRQGACRRRENMVGVNMVLAEYHQIQTWLL